MDSNVAADYAMVADVALGADVAVATDVALAADAAVAADAADGTSVTAQLGVFATDVRTASDAALGGSGPQVCSSAIPAIPVASDSEVEAAALRYVSAVIGIPTTAITADLQTCGDQSHAACANIFQNDVAHFGGANALTTFPLAQQIDASATEVIVIVFSPSNDAGMSLTADVVMAGIREGWLMGIATFGDRSTCQ